MVSVGIRVGVRVSVRVMSSVSGGVREIVVVSDPAWRLVGSGLERCAGEAETRLACS